MRKIIIIGALSFLAFFILTVPANGSTVTESHIVLIAEQNDTEVDITVDGKDRGTMYLQAGVNYRAYKTDEKPDVTVLAYGDTLDLKMTEGKGNDWYTFCRVMPPEDGDGEWYE